MAQLAGSHCVLCQGRIGSELDGRFCEGCGNPVHLTYEAKPDSLAGGVCADCGTNLAEAGLLWTRETGERRPVPRGTGPYPISSVCPRCTNTTYRVVKAQSFIAFRWDRVCKACHTRYTLPTPLWAGVLFLVVGFSLAGLGVFSLAVVAVDGGCPVCEGFFGFLGVLFGVLSIVHGIRSLMSPGRA